MGFKKFGCIIMGFALKLEVASLEIEMNAEIQKRLVSQQADQCKGFTNLVTSDCRLVPVGEDLVTLHLSYFCL